MVLGWIFGWLFLVRYMLVVFGWIFFAGGLGFDILLVVFG